MWESEKGKIHALMRSTRGRIYRSDSTDYGKTWCEAYPTQLPNNCCGIDAVRMENGTLAVVYNPIPYNWGKRSPLSVSLSEDNGKTFSEPFHLEMEPGEYSYPSVTAQGNMLNIFYTENRRTFVHCIVSVWTRHIILTPNSANTFAVFPLFGVNCCYIIFKYIIAFWLSWCVLSLSSKNCSRYFA